MRVIGFDTETWRIGPGAVAPKMVTLTIAERINGVIEKRLWGNGDLDFEQQCSRLLDLGHVLVGHNTAYDLTVITENFPHLEAKTWAKLDAGEITDTMIRQMLLNLSTFGHIKEIPLPSGSSACVEYGLDNLVMDRFGVDISGDKDSPDSPRLNFHIMDGHKGSEYSPLYREYALGDADWALQIFEVQEADVRSETGASSLSTDRFRTACHYALQKMTIRGLATDPAYYAKLRDMLAEELSEEKLPRLFRAGVLKRAVPPIPHKRQIPKALEALGEDPEASYDWSILDDSVRELLSVEHGIKWKQPENVKKNMEGLRRVIARVAKLNHIELKMTDGKEPAISTDAEVVADLASFSSTITQYKHWASFQKLLTTDLPKLEWNGKISPVVHVPFRPLLETGRTSSSASDKYPSMNGQQQGPKVRPCYVPRPGFLISSVDYATLELATTAQVTYDMFGFSEHRNRINAGIDMHAFLGAQMAARFSLTFRLVAAGMSVDDAYKAFIALKKSPHEDDRNFYEKWRKFAKPVGLGFPGGLGPLTFLQFAKTTYEVDLVKLVDEIGYRPDYDPRLMIYAKRLYKWKDASEFRWTKMLKACALAIELRDLWYGLYPEMPEFFKVVKGMKDPEHEFIGEIDGRPVPGLCYTSPLGMHRAATSFTNTANGVAMQTPAAEGALTAVLAVSRACYDPTLRSILYQKAFPLIFIHDEILSEIWAEDGLAGKRADEIGSIMVQSMRLLCPDVEIKTEATLSERWSKSAKMVRDAEGNLLVWRPAEGKSY